MNKLTALDKSVIAMVIGCIGAIIYIFASQAVHNSKYKYKIQYSHGRYDGTNYTDTFQIQAGPCIKYTDEHGTEVTRYGSFSIEPNN